MYSRASCSYYEIRLPYYFLFYFFLPLLFDFCNLLFPLLGALAELLLGVELLLEVELLSDDELVELLV
jgi:hypothetical protein